MRHWLFILPLLVGCTSIKSTQIEDADYSQYRHYIIAATNVQDSLNPVNGFIRQVLHSELTTKGLTVVASAPDLYISYYIAQKNELTYFDPATLPWTFYPRNPLESQDIAIGSLVIELIDAKQQNIIWRGFKAKAPGSNQWNQLTRAQLRETLHNMIQRFPF